MTFSHGLPTNNLGSCIANLADPLRKIHPHWVRPPPECENIVTGLKFQEHQQNPDIKVGHLGKCDCPHFRVNPILSREGHSAVGKLASHMCCKKHFHLDPAKEWVSAFSLYLPLFSKLF